MPQDYEPDDRAAPDGEGQVSEVSAMDPAGPDQIDPSDAPTRPAGADERVLPLVSGRIVRRGVARGAAARQSRTQHSWRCRRHEPVSLEDGHGQELPRQPG